MSAVTTAILLGLLAAAWYGVGDFFGARSSQQMGPVTAAFCVHLVGAAAVCLWFIGFVRHIDVTGEALWCIAAGAALVGVGAVLLYKAFDVGPVALTSVLGSAYPLFTAATGLAVFGARFTLAQLAGVMLMVFGVMAASGLIRLRHSEHRFGRGATYALLTSLTWGVGYSFLDHAVALAGWRTVIFLQVLIMLPVIGALWWRSARRERASVRSLRRVLRDPFILGAGLMQIAADFILNRGFVFDPAAGTLVVATSACYPVITAMLAFRHLHERPGKVPMLGAFATVTGVVFLLL